MTLVRGVVSVSSSIALTLLVAGCASGSRSAAEDRASCEWHVCVRWRDVRSGRTYYVINGGPVPATVRLEIRALQNLQIPPRLPIERVVPARSSATLVFLDVVARRVPTAAQTSVSIDLGASDTEPDDYLYGMPFGGAEARPLLQGFNESDTHMLAMRYALDFAMPEGTPVLAARSGIVVHVQDGFTAGGIDPDLLDRANLVVVGHSDGTLASYGHLSPGVLVAIDDSVEEGHLLGYSGVTGFAGRPHLHFHVGVRALGDPGRTVRVRLKNAGGREVQLRTGQSYEPARAARATR